MFSNMVVCLWKFWTGFLVLPGVLNHMSSTSGIDGLDSDLLFVMGSLARMVSNSPVVKDLSCWWKCLFYALPVFKHQFLQIVYYLHSTDLCYAMLEARESQIHFRLLSRRSKRGSSRQQLLLNWSWQLWIPLAVSTAWGFTRCRTRGLWIGVKRCKVSGMSSCTAATWQCGWSQCAQESTSLELDLTISSWTLHPFMDLRDNGDTYLPFFTCQEHDYIPLTQLLLLTWNVWWMCQQFH